MSLDEFLQNRLAISLVSLLAGTILAQLISALKGKTRLLGYFTYFNRIGLSVDDQIFGSIRLQWETHDLRNLYSYSIEIENLTGTDFEDFTFEVYTGDATTLLNQKTEIVNTPHIIYYSKQYDEEITVAPGDEPTQAQFDAYHHRREYVVPVFNRGERLLLTYLCTRPNDDDDPFIDVTTRTKGVNFKRLKNPYVLLKPIFGVPIPVAASRSIIVALAMVFFCAAFVSRPWLASLLSITTGLTAQILGAAVYRVERYVKNAIQG